LAGDPLFVKHPTMSAQDGYCPNCGAEVPSDAKACPQCGSCEETGWSEKAKYERIDVDYDDAFDYDSFVDEQFRGGKSRRKSTTQWAWTIVAILLIALFVKYYFNIF
jgi:uncharacterized membrane protein YvbJ